MRTGSTVSVSAAFSSARGALPDLSTIMPRRAKKITASAMTTRRPRL
jgi:hypothetical protein